MPEVLPTRVPCLLVNGSSGIAVGMATNIPPHNLSEVIEACLMMLEKPEVELSELLTVVSGPDFPTGGIINGRAGILDAYRTGRGRIYVRAKAGVEVDKAEREKIVITEIPYQLNKSKLIEKIAELVKEKKVEGISELRDESDKDGLRIVIELRRGESGEVLLNNLYSQTQLQTAYGINNVALVKGEPKVLNLKEMLEAFLSHRREVVLRRTLFLLKRAQQRGHILEGQAVALANIDEVIQLIRESSSASEAREALTGRRWVATVLESLLEQVGFDACKPEGLSDQHGFHDGSYLLSEEQAQAILEIRLHRLTAMEQTKLIDDYKGILEEIGSLKEILGSESKLIAVIRGELEDIKSEFGDERRTEIIDSQEDFADEDLIAEEELVVTISHQGYAKTQPLDVYQAQGRGGRGKAATAVKDEDFVEHLLITNSHNVLLCFSNIGKVYWLKVFQIPQGSRTAKGRPMINLLPLSEDERITAVLPVTSYLEDHFVFMATANGTVKKTPLEQFSRSRTSGLIALELDENNTLIGAEITNGKSDIMLCSSSGKAIRFNETAVRSMGRNARGVRGIKLGDSENLISLIIPSEGYLLSASQNGYGKRTPMKDFPAKGRGGQGVIAIQTSERNGKMIGATQVFDGDEVMLISNSGTLVRIPTEQISVVGRNTQGVKLISLKEGELLNSVERIADRQEDQTKD